MISETQINEPNQVRESAAARAGEHHAATTNNKNKKRAPPTSVYEIIDSLYDSGYITTLRNRQKLNDIYRAYDVMEAEYEARALVTTSADEYYYHTELSNRLIDAYHKVFTPKLTTKYLTLIYKKIYHLGLAHDKARKTDPALDAWLSLKEERLKIEGIDPYHWRSTIPKRCRSANSASRRAAGAATAIAATAEETRAAGDLRDDDISSIAVTLSSTTTGGGGHSDYYTEQRAAKRMKRDDSDRDSDCDSDSDSSLSDNDDILADQEQQQQCMKNPIQCSRGQRVVFHY